MKKLFVSAGVVSAMFLSSCGGGPSICDCIKTSTDAITEMGEAGADADKMKTVEEKYKSDLEACMKMQDDLEKSMEGLSDEEKAAKQEEMMKEMEACK